MNALEFQATIRNGVITLPFNQQSWNGKRIKVILLDESNASARESSGNELSAEEDFFNCAGIWENRDDISQESIRAKAWPDKKR